MNKNTKWTIPEPTSVCEVQLEDDSSTYVRRFGNPAGRRLVLSHGNGLAIDLYYPFWSLLIDDFDLIVFDLRNHGWNSVGPKENHNIPFLVRDLGRILGEINSQFGKKPTIGVFHSVSALIALLYSSELKILMSLTDSPEFSAMILFDPPIFKPGHDDAGFDDAVQKTAKLMRIRGNSFNTRDEFTELIRFHRISGTLFLALLNSCPKRHSANRQLVTVSNSDVHQNTKRKSLTISGVIQRWWNLMHLFAQPKSSVLIH